MAPSSPLVVKMDGMERRQLCWQEAQGVAVAPKGTTECKTMRQLIPMLLVEANDLRTMLELQSDFWLCLGFKHLSFAGSFSSLISTIAFQGCSPTGLS
jgi:hypothetical protein